MSSKVREPSLDTPVQVTMQDETSRMRKEQLFQTTGICEPFEAVLEPSSWVVDGMVHYQDRELVFQLRAREYFLKRRKLVVTKSAGGDEGRPRERGRQADDGRRASQLDDRKHPAWMLHPISGQIRIEVSSEVPREPAGLLRAARVDVVVSGDDGDRAGWQAEDPVEDGENRLELRFEREVRHVTGDDDMVHFRFGEPVRYGAHDLALVKVTAAEQDVGVPGGSLVEEPKRN